MHRLCCDEGCIVVVTAAAAAAAAGLAFDREAAPQSIARDIVDGASEYSSSDISANFF